MPSIIFPLIAAIFSVTGVFGYQYFQQPSFGDGTGTINQLNQWRTSGGRVELASTTAGIRVASLVSLDCIGTDGDGDFGAGTCVGGAGGGSNWQFSGANAIAPTTTVGILVSASSTLGSGTQAGGLTISGGATTTGTSNSGSLLPLLDLTHDLGSASKQWNDSWISNINASSMNVDTINTAAEGSAISVVDRTLLDSVGNVSVDWENYSLLDSGGDPSIDWNTFILSDGAGNTTVNWLSGLLRETDGSTAINWLNQTLHDAGGTERLDFSTAVVDLTGDLTVSIGVSAASSTVSGTTTTQGLAITGSANLFGTVGSALSDFCEAITGGAGLCDGADASGSGSGLATSTPIVDTYVIYGTSADAVGAEAAFTYDDATNLLTVDDLLVNDPTATSTFDGSIQIGATAGDNALKMTASRNYPSSNSTGGMMNMNNTSNTGSALVGYTEQAASAASLYSFRVNSATFAHSALALPYLGAGDALSIPCLDPCSNAISASNTGVDHTATLSYTGTTVDKGALNLTSTNVLGSVFQITGDVDGLGVGKITHSGNGDAASSILSLAASDATYAGQGIFLDMGTSTLTQKLLNIRGDGNEVLTTSAFGTTTLLALDVTTALDIFNNYYTTFASFAQGIVQAVTSATLQGTWDFSGATVKQHTYASFTYATTTAWTATTTIPLGPAYTAENWSGVKCFTDAGTLNVSFYDGTNRMNLFNASTTVGTVTLSTNNTFTASEKRYVDIGTPASSPAKISCTVDKIVNN